MIDVPSLPVVFSLNDFRAVGEVVGDVASRILRTVERRAAAASTDVLAVGGLQGLGVVAHAVGDDRGDGRSGCPEVGFQPVAESVVQSGALLSFCLSVTGGREEGLIPSTRRSEEHTSELQSLMRISYAVFCLNNKKHRNS